MSASSHLELIHLADEEQSVSLRVLGGIGFSGTGRYDVLHAGIVVSTGFASGRVGLYRDAYELDRWAKVLESFAGGRKAAGWTAHRQLLADVRSRFPREP